MDRLLANVVRKNSVPSSQILKYTATRRLAIEERHSRRGCAHNVGAGPASSHPKARRERFCLTNSKAALKSVIDTPQMGDRFAQLTIRSTGLTNLSHGTLLGLGKSPGMQHLPIPRKPCIPPSSSRPGCRGYNARSCKGFAVQGGKLRSWHRLRFS
jgi:hypothetical protein